MTDQFRPIETQYKGYRFRSRLEARWAVVLDHMMLEWRYEEEGFELPGVGRYLPDFFVVDWDAYLEIKPTAGDFGREAHEKARALCRESGKAVYIVGGSFDDNGAAAYLPERAELNDPGERVGLVGDFVACARCGVGCLRLLVVLDTGLLPYSIRPLSQSVPHRRCPHDEFLRPDEGHIAAAFRAGKSARFEFGESG